MPHASRGHQLLRFGQSASPTTRNTIMYNTCGTAGGTAAALRHCGTATLHGFLRAFSQPKPVLSWNLHVPTRADQTTPTPPSEQ